MRRRLLAEALGTALLVIAVVGSGITAQRSSPGDVGLQLLENALATAFALAAIILALGPVSGAHLNPVVSAVHVALGGLGRRVAGAYVVAQLAGGGLGAIAANLMFGLPPIVLSARERSSPALWLSEVIATAGLLLVVFGTARGGGAGMTAFAVAAYIGGAYFFTSSTGVANPAVTLARTLSDTFAGIAPGSAPGFLAAQIVGGGVGLGLVRVLYPRAG